MPALALRRLPGRSGAGVAAAADAEEAQLVIGDPEAMGVPHATPEPRQHVCLEEASLEILYLAAEPTDQVMVVRHERLGELVPALPLGGVGRPDEAHVTEELHRAIHGHEVRALSAEGVMKLRDGARLLAGCEGAEHRPPWCGDAVSPARQQPRDRIARILGDRGRGGVDAHCVWRAGGVTPTAR